jgi:glycopeptide antibiotics resistance protein
MPYEFNILSHKNESYTTLKFCYCLYQIVILYIILLFSFFFLVAMSNKKENKNKYTKYYIGTLPKNDYRAPVCGMIFFYARNPARTGIGLHNDLKTDTMTTKYSVYLSLEFCYSLYQIVTLYIILLFYFFLLS